jgi:hypothetical protein
VTQRATARLAGAAAARAGWAAVGGIVGALALGASFAILPRPPALGAPVHILLDYARHHHDLLLAAACLEAIGAALYLLFLVALARVAGGAERLSTQLTAVAGAVVLLISIVYDVFLIAIAQSAAVAGPQVTTGVVAYGLFAACEHVFLLAPSVFLPLAVAIWGAQVLPRGFALSALGLGCASEILGIIGVFLARPNNGGAAGTAINILVGLEALWVIAAAAVTLRRNGVPSGLPS